MIHKASFGPKNVIPAAPARKAAINVGVRFPRVNNRQMMTQAAAINQVRARLKYVTGKTAPNVSSDEIIARAAKTNTLRYSCVSHPSDQLCTTKRKRALIERPYRSAPTVPAESKALIKPLPS